MAKPKRMAPAEPYVPERRHHGSRVPTPVWLLLVAAACVGGFFAHDYLLPHDGPRFGTLGETLTLTESQLDEPVATYVLDGETYEVTAREAILQGSSLDGARTQDGAYAMPSAEGALSAARTAIVGRAAQEQGIEVSDEELAAYAEQTFGTSDLATLAEAYGMDEETVRARLRESAAMAELREKVVKSEPGEEPEEPPTPTDGDADAKSADCAAYIIALAGDEWDGEANGWADPEGAYATALKDYDIRNDSASYDAARTAYYVACERHGDAQDAAAQEWTDYVNGLLSGAQMALCSLVS